MNVVIRNTDGTKELLSVPYVHPNDIPAPENRNIVTDDLLTQSINNLSYIARRLSYV